MVAALLGEYVIGAEQRAACCVIAAIDGDELEQVGEHVAHGEVERILAAIPPVVPLAPMVYPAPVPFEPHW